MKIQLKDGIWIGLSNKTVYDAYYLRRKKNTLYTRFSSDDGGLVADVVIKIKQSFYTDDYIVAIFAALLNIMDQIDLNCNIDIYCIDKIALVINGSNYFLLDIFQQAMLPVLKVDATAYATKDGVIFIGKDNFGLNDLITIDDFEICKKGGDKNESENL